MTVSEQPKNNGGRFALGTSGNPNGARLHKTAEQKLLASIEKKAPALIERSLTVAQTDNAVLAEVVRYLTECLHTKNLQAAVELAAVKYAGTPSVDGLSGQH